MSLLKDLDGNSLLFSPDFFTLNLQRVVPLRASFQDLNHLYLVMDYMPGGDFLGLLIRDNILPEPVAKWYVAEMILCIEEAHALRWSKYIPISDRRCLSGHTQM